MSAALNRPERLDFLALRFSCRAAGTFVLENPCSDLHGGFGLMLHAHFRLIYEDLFGAQADSGAVRAYVLRPGPALFAAVKSGQLFGFDLLLFGSAARHTAACAEALGQLGANGVTPARHRYAVEHIERLAPDGTTTLWSPTDGWNVRALQPCAAAELLAEPLPAGPVRIDLDTPLAIKHGNELLRDGLSAEVFFERLLGRAQLLATQQAGGPLLDPDAKRALLADARALTLARDATTWRAASRYSARQRQRSEFGGLVGHFVLRSAPGPLAGWLRLAEWLHVGSKTSFGFGACRLSTAACEQ